MLKHDKVLSKKPPAPHLRDVPEYLVDATTREASKVVKLARAAMGNNNPSRHHGSKKKFRRNKDPLKTFSAEVFGLPIYLVAIILALEVSYVLDICIKKSSCQLLGIKYS